MNINTTKFSNFGLLENIFLILNKMCARFGCCNILWSRSKIYCKSFLSLYRQYGLG